MTTTSNKVSFLPYAIGMLVSLLVLHGSFELHNYMKQQYYNTEGGKQEMAWLRSVQEKELANKNLQIQADLARRYAVPDPVPHPSAGVLAISPSNGEHVNLRPGMRVVLNGPTTFTMVQSLHLVKNIQGEYKLSVEKDGVEVWTPGFSSATPPFTPDEFLSQFRHLGHQLTIRVTVNSGTVIINT